MKRTLRREMGDFIGSKEMEWNLFLTLTYKNGCNEKFNRGVMENYFNKNRNLINRMFFVSERNKNFTDIHSHFLIYSNSICKLKRKSGSLRKLGHLDIREVDYSEFMTDEGILNVGYYISKFIDKDIDYDFFF